MARLGTDEFGVLVVGPSPGRAIARVHERARRVLLGVVLPSGVEVPVTARAGYAVNSDPATTAAELLRNADLALSRARTSRHVALQPYSSSMHAELVARADAEVSLRRAFDQRELELHYQPVVELPSRRIVGVEALVRWRHPTRGLLTAGEFLGLIDELGLSQRLCSWVVLNSAVAAAAMVAVHPSNERVAVGFNVGAGDLVDHLVDEIERAVASVGLTPQRLVVEVTEESLVATDSAREVIARLRLGGFKVAIDDFGVGFSSLSYLADIPVDFIKIDRSFVNDVTHGSTKAALVAAVLALGENLGLDTVVEGLETADEVDVVQSLGARYAQGWHFARALPLPALLELLAAQAAQEAASPDGVVIRYVMPTDPPPEPKLAVAPRPVPHLREVAGSREHSRRS